MPRIAAAPFLVVLGLTACSGVDPSSASAPVASDDPPHAAPGARDVSSVQLPHAPLDAPVLEQSFEDASPQCNDWTSEGATSIRSIPPHSGDYACKVCATGESQAFALAHETGQLAKGVYALSAFVRSRPTSVAPASAALVLEADTPSGTVVSRAPLAVGDAYVRVETALELAEAASAVRFRIEAPGDAQTCVLVDDVLVVRR